MKRTGYIYNSICDIENIKKAIMKSSLGKRQQVRVKEVLDNIDEYAAYLEESLYKMFSMWYATSTLVLI